MSRIIFYDLACKKPNYAWGPNNWKIRYALNYKRIPYTTEWLEFTEIEAICREKGIPPTMKKVDGSPMYTLPAIWDPNTKTGLADSLTIAAYLERTYPDTPATFFPGITNPEYMQIMNAITLPEMKGIRWFVVPRVCDLLNEASQPYFRSTREAMFGRRLEDVLPKEGEEAQAVWGEVRKGLDIVDGWLAESRARASAGESGSSGPFARGEQVTYVDFALAGYLVWVRYVLGEDSWQWKDILVQNEGRWRMLIEGLEKYEKPMPEERNA
ncbi:hypothetical protein AMATHDRAFT_76675 [Amanita thiersii Skay4041]|uniref:GST N-terminal domain-containing protein n=1 Tax=Amanita thiersii Skay4041 TaxID=703135 RepID=A0A2A9NL96_9AGAR|nr:hypothetical protein AMATHDRAFT_76675 [Amanita thiersii Skay4041]